MWQQQLLQVWGWGGCRGGAGGATGLGRNQAAFTGALLLSAMRLGKFGVATFLPWGFGDASPGVGLGSFGDVPVSVRDWEGLVMPQCWHRSSAMPVLVWGWGVLAALWSVAQEQASVVMPEPAWDWEVVMVPLSPCRALMSQSWHGSGKAVVIPQSCCGQ